MKTVANILKVLLYIAAWCIGTHLVIVSIIKNLPERPPMQPMTCLEFLEDQIKVSEGYRNAVIDLGKELHKLGHPKYCPNGQRVAPPADLCM